MATKFMVGVILTLLVTLGGLSWYLKHVIEEKGELLSENANLQHELQVAGKINKSLHRAYQDLQARNKYVLERVKAAESEKAEFRKQAERTKRELREALQQEAVWDKTPIPASVASAVNADIERLRLAAANQNRDAGGSPDG